MDLSKLTTIREKFLKLIDEATVIDEINAIRLETIGKKGEITLLMKEIKDIEPSQRKAFGEAVNQVKTAITERLEARKEVFEKEGIVKAIMAEKIDVTLPGNQKPLGSRHVITQIIEEIEDLFLSMGYEVIEGNELEQDFYNFERMNIPKDHPARDMQDTFYIDNESLLRTHTSPVQAHTMDSHDFSQGPLMMISPGKVYRRDDDDATHSHQFHQIEGLVVDEGITLSDLQGTLAEFAKAMFGEEREVRMRPSFFPFTEPSVELDISCFKCGGEGCSICKRTGWIEILGGGIVHPQVLEMSNIDSTTYTGFAFGLGPDRVAMLKYGVDDIRHFYQNDTRFLQQFNVKEL